MIVYESKIGLGRRDSTDLNGADSKPRASFGLVDEPIDDLVSSLRHMGKCRLV